MKSDKLTDNFLNTLKEKIAISRGDIISMFVGLLSEINNPIESETFIKYYTGTDSMRYEVLRDMVLNGWFYVNENGCIEIGTMPSHKEIEVEDG